MVLYMYTGVHRYNVCIGDIILQYAFIGHISVLYIL